MAQNMLQLLNQLAAYFKIQGVKLTLDEHNIPVCTHKTKTVHGVVNTICYFIEAANAVHLRIKLQPEADQARIHQWIEYLTIYCMNPNFTHVLKELNEVFALKTYLVNDQPSIADILLYYAMYNFMDSLSYLDKEKYVHLSRWFDNMQQDKRVRQKNKLIDFKTNYLVSVAPARH